MVFKPIDHADNQGYQHQRHRNQLQEPQEDRPERPDPMVDEGLKMKDNAQQAQADSQGHANQNLGIQRKSFSI